MGADPPTPRFVHCLFLALALGGVLVSPAPANAASMTVTNLSDSGAGSLRQAILDANKRAGTTPSRSPTSLAATPEPCDPSRRCQRSPIPSILMGLAPLLSACTET
jgi:hypothetical protein